MYKKIQLFQTRRALYTGMLLILLLSTFANRGVYSALAQTGTTTHQITYFQGNKAGAISFTFDDGYTSQATTAVSSLNARGLKGTFFIITGDSYINNNVSWATWRSIAAQGHDVQCHTVTHPRLPTLSDNEVRWELSQSQADVNQNLGRPCITMAYPYTQSNNTVQTIAAEYYIAARGGYVWPNRYLNYYQSGQDQNGSWSAINFYNIAGLGADYLPVNNQYLIDADFNNSLDEAVSRHAWFVLYFHDIYDANAFGDILDYVQGRDLYWIDTFGNISRYMKERLNSTAQVIAETNAEIRLQIAMDAALPTAIYNVPLTIRSTVPASWGQVIVQQGSNTQTFTPVIEDGEKVVYYNALPNGGDVLLLNTPYPVPSITSLNPSSAFAGGSAFTLTVNGNNFVTGSIVRWNNSDRATTYVSSTQLRASIPASDISFVGTANVRVFNPSPGGGLSGQLPFSINQPPPPGAFTKSSPADGKTNLSASPTLNWDASAAAGSYEYCYDTTNDNACTNWVNSGNSTSTTLSGLTADTTYYWHVRASNISGTTYSNGSATEFWSFTTLPDPPGAFTKTSPSDGEINQSTSRTLSWSASVGATSYEYCFDMTNDNACSAWVNNGVSTSAVINSLSADATYYWHVRAFNAGGETYSNGSDTAFWSFEVDNTVPVLSSINRAGTSPTNQATVDFIVTFSKNITGGNAANFALAPNGNVTGASIVSVTGSGATRTVSVDTGSSDGTIGLNMTNGTGITDIAGNALNTDNLPFTGDIYIIQKSGPVVSISTPSAVVTTAGPVDFEINITGANTINIQNTDVILKKTGMADATTVDVTNGDTANPMVTISGITGDGTIGISIPAGIATDTLGNPSLETGPSIIFVDNTAPQIAVDGVDSNAGIIGYDFQVITTNISQFKIKFSEDAYDPPGDSDPKDVTNPDNYLLVRDLGTISDFQTAGCTSPGAVEPDDTKIAVESPIVYDSETFTATFTVNGDFPLSNGYYRLFVCGSTSITDHVGLHLAGNGTAGTDFLRSLIVNVPDGGGVTGDSNNGSNQVDINLRPASGLIPVTGFAPTHVTDLPKQPASLAYTSTGEMRLEIPDLGINIPIIGVKQDSAGWNLTWLGNNAGYLDGTAYPTWAGNTVLTAHVVDATNSPGPFAHLKDLKNGARVYIHANGSLYIYQVKKNMVVSLYSTAAVFEHEEYDWLTLVTCENYSDLLKSYASRRVVKAVLVSKIPEE